MDCALSSLLVPSGFRSVQFELLLNIHCTQLPLPATCKAIDMHLAITQPRSQRGLFGRQQRQQVSGRRLAWATTCQRQQQQVELSWGGKTAAMPKAVCVVGRQAAADLQLDAEQGEQLFDLAPYLYC